MGHIHMVSSTTVLPMTHNSSSHLSLTLTSGCSSAGTQNISSWQFITWRWIPGRFICCIFQEMSTSSSSSPMKTNWAVLLKISSFYCFMVSYCSHVGGISLSSRWNEVLTSQQVKWNTRCRMQQPSSSSIIVSGGRKFSSLCVQLSH